MINKCLFLSLCIWLLSEHAMSVPLINSQFARDNPGKIPYSSCKLQGSLVAQLDLGFFGFSDKIERVWLNCHSKKHGVTAEIPVSMGNSLRVGLGLGFREGDLELKVKGLHGKTVGQIFGEYRGVSASFINVGFQKHINAHGVSIRGITGGNGISAVLGLGKFELYENKDGRLSSFRHDPYLIFGDTVYEHSDSTYLFEEPYFYVREPNRQINQVFLQLPQERIRLSIGDELSIDQKTSINLRSRLISVRGEKIHFMNVKKRKSDQMIMLQNPDGSWSYQTLKGTFTYRLADEHEPDFRQLSELRFVKDDARPILLAPEEEVYDNGSLEMTLLK